MHTWTNYGPAVIVSAINSGLEAADCVKRTLPSTASGIRTVGIGCVEHGVSVAPESRACLRPIFLPIGFPNASLCWILLNDASDDFTYAATSATG